MWDDHVFAWFDQLSGLKSALSHFEFTDQRAIALSLSEFIWKRV